MASKNINIIVGIVLVIVAFFIGTYLPKIFMDKDDKNSDVQQAKIGPEYDHNYKHKRNMESLSGIPLKVSKETPKYLGGDFIFTDIDAGKDVPLSDFRGKFVVLNLWRNGCSICAYELSSLMQIKRDYQGQPIEFIALSLDARRISETYNFLKKNNLRLSPIYVDSRHTLSSYKRGIKVPETLFIGPSGKILGSINQPINWNTKESRQILHRYLKQVGMSK